MIFQIFLQFPPEIPESTETKVSVYCYMYTMSLQETGKEEIGIPLLKQLK